jgi:acetolactate synthase I/II/III large subunit
VVQTKTDASAIAVRNRAGGRVADAMSHDLFVDLTDVGALATPIKAALDPEGSSVVSVECSADEIRPFAAFLDAPHHPVRDRG